MNVKCHKCQKISTAEKWNIETEKKYGEDIGLIEEDNGECLFVCPQCLQICCNAKDDYYGEHGFTKEEKDEKIQRA